MSIDRCVICEAPLAGGDTIHRKNCPFYPISWVGMLEGFERNHRSVWNINTRPFSGAHFAVMPEELAETCILAGCPVGGTVIDPFSGSGTVGVVAARHGRNYIGIELNPKYARMSYRRFLRDAPLVNSAPADLDLTELDGLPLFESTV